MAQSSKKPGFKVSGKLDPAIVPVVADTLALSTLDSGKVRLGACAPPVWPTRQPLRGLPRS